MSVTLCSPSSPSPTSMPTHHVLHTPLSKHDLVGRLVQAIGKHQHTETASLIAAGADVNGMTASGTPLFMAVAAQNTPAITALVARGVDLDAPGQAWSNEQGVVQGPPPIVHAMRNARLDVVRHLLDLGASPTAVDGYGISLLNIATTRSRGAEGATQAVVDALVKTGQAPDPTDWTLMVEHQIGRGAYKILEALLNLPVPTVTTERRERLEYAFNECCPPPDKKKIRPLLDRVLVHAYVQQERQALHETMQHENGTAASAVVSTDSARRRL